VLSEQVALEQVLSKEMSYLKTTVLVELLLEKSVL